MSPRPPGRLALVGLALACAACASRPLHMPELASSRVVEDLDTYRLQRVGILPFSGADVSSEQALQLQAAFHSELAQAVPFELVPLAAGDLAEIEESDPQRLGWYRPKTIIDLSRRYSLDGLVFGSVTQQRFFPPQILSVQVELVSAETGLVLWSSAVHLDGSDPRVQDGLQIFYGSASRDTSGSPSWDVALLSPERFARFAAFQIARRFE